MSSLKHQHPHYKANSQKWEYALDHYTGDVLEKLDRYLIRHSHGETEAAYKERKKIFDYTPHYAFAIDSLCGMLFAVEGEASRTWERQTEEGEPAGESLGDPEAEGTIMSRLWDNADGEGGNWLVRWKELCPRLIVTKVYWVLVEGPQQVDGRLEGEAKVVLISPVDVLDWDHENGRLKWVKVRHREIAERESWRAEAKEVERYTIYSLEGWERYEEKKDGEGDVLIASGTYEYFETPDRNRSILPINVFEIPIARNLGYQMARKFNAIANIESSRDFLIWAANFIRLRIETDDTDEVVNEKLAKGWNWFRGTALEFVNPSSEPTVNASKVIEDKLKQAYLTFFREYGDAARERTATEIRQDIQSGIQACLVLIKEAIDEAENFALKILEQIYFPNNPSAWGQASVRRSDKFQPDNPDDVAEKLVARYISQRVPAGRTALINLVKKLLEMDGIAYQPEEVEAEVDEFLANPVGVPGVDGTPGGDGQSGLIPQITRRDNERVRLLRQTVESIQAREEE